jgi:hypothetical protein
LGSRIGFPTFLAYVAMFLFGKLPSCNLFYGRLWLLQLWFANLIGSFLDIYSCFPLTFEKQNNVFIFPLCVFLINYFHGFPYQLPSSPTTLGSEHVSVNMNL